jgi:hypothetical protein
LVTESRNTRGRINEEKNGNKKRNGKVVRVLNYTPAMKMYGNVKVQLQASLTPALN